MQAGPLRDHLTEIGGRLDEAVDECWRVARRGQLPGHRPQPGRRPRGSPQLAALEAQAGGRCRRARTQAAHRRGAAGPDRHRPADGRRADDTHSRLQLLDARLDETVTRAIELSVQADTPADLGGLGDDVEGLVSEMEALRQGLDEVGRRQDFPDLERHRPSCRRAGPASASRRRAPRQAAIRRSA